MKFRKKPVEVEAILWDNTNERLSEIMLLSDARKVEKVTKTKQLSIQTLEGTMLANLGDWIIKGVKGELYPCRNDIFLATYDKVD